MIPLKNEDAGKGVPLFTLGLIAACTAVFFYQASIREKGLIPLDFIYAFFHPENLSSASLMLLFSFFLHGGIVHLVSNMWYLWIFGSAAERRVGPLYYLPVYLVCGVLSMVIQVASSPLSSIPIVGASGAIAGIMGMDLVLLPLSRVIVYVPPVFLLRVPAFIFLVLWFLIQYINLGHSGNHGGIAWWAHIGGFVTGLVLAFLIRKKVPPGRRSRR